MPIRLEDIGKESQRLSDVMGRREPETIRLDAVQALEPVEDKMGLLESLDVGIRETMAKTSGTYGKVLMMFGNHVREKGLGFVIPGNYMVPDNVVDSFGSRIAKAGRMMVERNNAAVSKMEFPEREEGITPSNIARDIGSGAVSIAESIGLGLTLGPGAAGVMFGAKAGGEGFVEAVDKKKPIPEALNIGAALGLAEGSLEFIGLDRFLKIEGGFIKTAIKGALTEGLQEFSQSATGEAIRIASGLNEFKGIESVKDVMAQSLYEGAIGAVLGGGASVTLGVAKKTDAENKLIETGIPKEEARIIVDDVFKKAQDSAITVVEEINQQYEKEAKLTKAIKVGDNIYSKEAPTTHDSIVVENEIDIKENVVPGYLDERGIFVKEFDEIGKESYKAKALPKQKRYVYDLIKQKDYKNVNNYIKKLDLPAVSKMDEKQIDTIVKSLEAFHKGDVFLSKRQMETVDKTSLAGVRTYRQAKQRFAKELGVSPNKLQNIQAKEIDRWTYDSALAGKNPIYKLLVEQTHKNMLVGEAEFLKREGKINQLTKDARNSKKRGLAEKLVPTDELVFEYLSSSNKESIAKNMTKEEKALADYLQQEYAEALDYLIKTKALETGRENYITNIRRDFFEALKEDGLVAAVKEMFEQYKLDEQKFDILDQKTNEILPLEKFFQFSIKRTGGMKPTKNVAKAANIYFRTLERKKALDAIIPEMMIYMESLKRTRITKQAQVMDAKLNKFIKEWLNVKKGRRVKALIKPGSKPDVMIRAAKTFVTIKDLALNIPVGLAAQIGETVVTYTLLGKKNIAKGVYRMNTKKGKQILSKYKNFIGKSLWEELAEPDSTLLDKSSMALFGLFKDSNIRANKITLLGSLTDQEWKTGEITPDRLSAIKIDMGRFRAIENLGSIMGSTTELSVINQYKKWAIPVLVTMSNNIKKTAGDIKQGNIRGAIRSKEARELMNAMEVTLSVLLVLSLTDDDSDNDFMSQIIRKARREALTILGAFDIELWFAVPRLAQWAINLAKAVKQIATLEKYKSKAKKYRGKFKGVEKLKRELTPRVFKTFEKINKKKTLRNK